ncbi:unnamed protein product [Vitrella brassicaformis CCMP3155]|uniref:Uncharacterized protein n=1 Tax=Vitrella brassicaformis (strain CCMP3155) TaxID=1169540 RepID=A0A0G4F121_VITBC|nr:unnamed protein product [Vitrella brassicaformis CCMP3155]|eukprot:CEM05219.1 unnamed protein product [Vitrella brassicaformis CCMP3155]
MISPAASPAFSIPSLRSTSLHRRHLLSSRRAEPGTKYEAGQGFVETKKKKPKVRRKDDAAAVAGTVPPPGDGEVGKAALRRMQLMEISKDERELQEFEEYEMRLKQLREAGKDGNAGTMPEVVSQRIISRIVPFFLTPLAFAFSTFIGGFLLYSQFDYRIEPSIIAYITQFSFLLALGGVSYGILSSSWEEDREGSFWGADEFKRNIKRVASGVRQTVKDTETRQRMETRRDMVIKYRQDQQAMDDIRGRGGGDKTA